MHADINQLIARLGQLRADKNMPAHTWDECYKYTIPVRGAGMLTGTGAITVNTSDDDQSAIYDATAVDAVIQLGSALVSGMAPANARWIDFDIADRPDYRSEWLDNAAETTWREIHASNFDSAFFDAVQDSIIAGMSALFVETDEQNQRLTFDEWPLSQCFFASSRLDGIIDECQRSYQMTAWQIAANFPDTCPKALQDKSRSGERVECIRAIYPRLFAADEKHGQLAKSMPYASVYYLPEFRTILRESGFRAFPLFSPRWMRLPCSVYGFGQVYLSLPFIKTLNEAQKMVLENAEMDIYGMWASHDDAIINPATTLEFGARKIIPLSEPNSLQSINAPGNFQIADVMITKMQADVRKSMMIDKLQIPENGNATAYELSIRMDMMRQLTGPVYGRWQSEGLAPMVEYCFGELLSIGKIPSPPQDLANSKLQVRFVSPLARAQRANEVAAMERFEAGLMQSAQVNPAIMDIYDWDGAAREKSWLLGVPQQFLLSDGKVKQIRDAKTEAHADAAEQDMADQTHLKAVK